MTENKGFIMIEGGIGGNATLTGLNFENKVDLITLLKQIKGYSIERQVYLVLRPIDQRSFSHGAI
jgi:hypothetical protein